MGVVPGSHAGQRPNLATWWLHEAKARQDLRAKCLICLVAGGCNRTRLYVHAIVPLARSLRANA